MNERNHTAVHPSQDMSDWIAFLIPIVETSLSAHPASSSKGLVQTWQSFRAHRYANTVRVLCKMQIEVICPCKEHIKLRKAMKMH